MFTIGRSGDAIVILTDTGVECAGLTKLTFTAEEMRDIVKQAAFLLGERLQPTPLRAVDSERAIVRITSVPADAPAEDALAEAMTNDSAEIERRRQAAEAKREQRRVAMLGSRAEEFNTGEE